MREALGVFFESWHLAALGTKHSLVVDQVEDGLGVFTQGWHLMEVSFHMRALPALPVEPLPDQD
jgi:hypothetical protein